MEAALTAQRTSPGRYQLTLDRQRVALGVAHVSAYVSSAICAVTDLSGATVSVACDDAAGAPVDTRFTLQLASNVAPVANRVVAFAYAGNASTPSYTPPSSYSYNATGGAITATRSAVGLYALRFAGLVMDSGNVQVSTYGLGANHCAVLGWSGDTANVSCFDAAGTPADAPYTLVFTQPGVASAARVAAYAWAHDPGAASYAVVSDYAFSASGGAITAERSGVGSYTLTFPGLSLARGVVQASAYGSSAHCTVALWSGSTAEVHCRNGAGTLVDSAYTLAVYQTGVASRAQSDAFVYASHPSTNGALGGAYTSNPSALAVQSTRVGPGSYLLRFDAANLSNGFASVTPYFSSAQCSIVDWSGDQVRVNCYGVGANAGVPADSEFTLSFVH
jgi:hypothetical protein